MSNGKKEAWVCYHLAMKKAKEKARPLPLLKESSFSFMVSCEEFLLTSNTAEIT